MGTGLRHRVRAAALRPVARMLSAGGRRGRLNVLIYHRVVEQADPLGFGGVTKDAFDWQMELLAGCCNVLALRDAVERLEAGSLPERAACVTFDDGYADNEELALPVLSSRGIPATFFVATGFLDGGRMFNDSVIESVRRCRRRELDLRAVGLERFTLDGDAARRDAVLRILRRVKHLPPTQRSRVVAAVEHEAGCDLPSSLMMTTAQLRRLADAGMDVGGHTVSHPILASLDDAGAEREIREGRDALAAATGRAVELFAYPNGKPGADYGPAHVSMVRSLGFRAAVCTAWGSAGRGSPLFELPRFTPWDTQPERFALRLLGNWRREQREFAAAPRARAVNA